MKYIPLGMLTVFLTKTMLQGSNVTAIDATILAILTFLFAYSQYKNEEKAVTEVKSELSLLKNQVADLEKRNEEVRSHISTMKIGMNMRSSSISTKQGQ